ncbi:flowering time control protein FPA-like isoform X1 [Zingiber officinale]|nr:flowering time control protein FPA-like isoform X1 [Zingiber officinale]XP_042440030.1 flowering time control protein FPA-like isoform X1 [Zingiber officinale]
MMGRSGGRDRISSDYMPRLEEKDRRSGWGVAPSSRHLWVGNLSPHVSQNSLYEHFLRFGDIENITYTPGRSYAFVNYKKEEDAVIASKGLQGFIMAGNPLRVEFAKGDRVSLSPLGDEYSHTNDGRYSTERGEPLLRRDFRSHDHSPERSHEKDKGNDSTEPCEELWIGFPSFLNVEKDDLRRAFSPFGEIDNISTFRSYAFVRYRSIVAACRAKEALQGKLFNNPRVQICFAKSDFTDSGRNLSNPPFVSHLKSNFRSVPKNAEPSRWDRGFDSHIENFPTSPRDARLLRSNEANFIDYGENSLVRPATIPGSIFGVNVEHNRMPELNSDRRMSEELYDRYRNSPTVERAGRWHDVPFERERRTPPLDDSWGIEDNSFPSSKKAKLDSFSEKELPEYPFSDLEQRKHDFGRMKFSPNLPYNSTFNKDFESAPLAPFTDRDESWRGLNYLHAGLGPLPSDIAKSPRASPERPPPQILDWKWEGTIAKGGTPVCRARCFPVGKVLDFMLPEFLNCTARTGLAMLAKHYYQATSSWVVFFVPENDTDFVFYNEFMHYLGEKQRVAVAKLGEKVTLFLVPPSDFSEQVLKVPGKMSISGVILKFQQPGSNFSSLHQPIEVAEAKLPTLQPPSSDFVSIHENASLAKSISPDLRAISKSQSYFNPSSGFLPPPYSPLQKLDENLPYSGSIQPMEKFSDYHLASRHERLQPLNSAKSPNWSNQMHIPTSDRGTCSPLLPSAGSQITSSSNAEPHPLGNLKVSQGYALSNYAAETSSIPLHTGKFPTQVHAEPQASSNVPSPLEPEQLAQLAILLGQHKQLGKEPSLSIEGQNKQSNLLQIVNSHALAPTPNGQASDQNSATHTHSFPSSSLGVQLNQVPQNQKQQSNIPAVQTFVNSGLQNQQADTEADPQKRLQATLQLAATLLQQIQQQSKTVDQP